ncbi:MAG: substrate-binding domain-containing protein [Salinisphaera sp.]|nr:substrate-binding domain-containing protein [Salinisphaera sp.]
MIHFLRYLFVLLSWALPCGGALAAEQYIVVASTTSTQNSGLLGYLLPVFEEKSGIDVRVIAVGTGAALDMARRCDADVLLVHAPKAEKKFVAEGYGVKRHPLMHNDFVIVGPKNDPARIRGMEDASKALAKIAAAEAVFVSRGDDSGTNKKEMILWRQTDVAPLAASGSWYRETGSGMGATLNTAQAMGAYTLTDRGTWISFNNRGNLELLVEGDPDLYNPYGIILVSPQRCPSVKIQAGKAFIDWMLSNAGQQRIADYRLKGRQLFIPDAVRQGAP